MAKIYVSGLINTETTVKVRKFPVDYYPIDYPFFGVRTEVSGVGYNLARALTTLGDEVILASYTGDDLQGSLVEQQLQRDGLSSALIRRELSQTPASVVLYDESGRRQIYCDLKDIQDRRYGCSREVLASCDVIAACNINFNRSLLHEARALGKPIATDVHVIRDVEDHYNREFLEMADIVFLSDEGLPCEPEEFLRWMQSRYHSKALILGRGGNGAMLLEGNGSFHVLPCFPAQRVTNTVGAGDALFSAFLHFHAKGMAAVDALWLAQVFASAKIEVSGASRGFIPEEEVYRRWNCR